MTGNREIGQGIEGDPDFFADEQRVREGLFHSWFLVYGVGGLETVDIAFAGIAEGGSDGFHA